MPAGKDRISRLKALEDDIEEMDLQNTRTVEGGRDRSRRSSGTNQETAIQADSPRSTSSRSAQISPARLPKASESPRNSDMSKSEHEETVGGEVTVKLEPGQPPKLARSSSQKIWTRPAPLFDDLPDQTAQAQSKFEVIPACIYGSKYMGSTEHGMDCDCNEEWDSLTKTNAACGEDSDCINRATKIECTGDCGCGPQCQNQRFQRRQYANVTVIQTEKKGYGLRADSNLKPGDFIFEYIGEVINEANFRKRTIQYNDEGIKHFYFMSLTKNEFVDATKKGNLGRFCNHSCNPNCYVDKWVVGEKLRMGLFAERKIRAGEELVFNYNVDRYGADPQPCYCGEPNCTGYIGGKTQTERATQLSLITIEALGIDDGDGWDTAVAKKPRKKKAGEDDEEYVNNVQPKSLDVDGVTKVMATLMQCKEKWIAVKVLGRIQRCDDERVRNRVVRMHGYRILSSTLSLWKDDFNVVQQVLDIIEKLPRLTRNKISDSGIESTVEGLRDCGNGRIETQVVALLAEWSTLEVAYRIPRKKREINDTAPPEKPDRYSRRESGPKERRVRSRSRSKSRSRSRSRSMDAPRGPAPPSGPRSGFPQRNSGFFGGPRPPARARIFVPPLPAGWHSTLSNGVPYYYTATGETTWTRPTMPAAPPPPPPKPTSANPALDAIIREIEESKANERKGREKASASATPQPATGELKSEKKDGKEKWRAYSEEKQKKLYENTVFPHIKHVVDKYKHKLPRDDLKKFCKQVSKKLVDSDYKNRRVKDPTRISLKQEGQIKKYTKDFFDKVVAQKRAHEKKKDERRAEREKQAGAPEESPNLALAQDGKKDDLSDAEPDMDLSDDEGGDQSKPLSATPATPADPMTNGDGGLKRKRTPEDGITGLHVVGDEATPSKRQKSETPPPPPPPPPAGMPPDQSEVAEQESAMEVDDAADDEVRNMANGYGSVHDQIFATESPTIQDSPPPPPPPTDQRELEASDTLFHDAGDVSVETPDTEPVTPCLGFESGRNGGFPSKHLQSVRGIQVRHGN